MTEALHTQCLHTQLPLVLVVSFFMNGNTFSHPHPPIPWTLTAHINQYLSAWPVITHITPYPKRWSLFNPQLSSYTSSTPWVQTRYFSHPAVFLILPTILTHGALLSVPSLSINSSAHTAKARLGCRHTVLHTQRSFWSSLPFSHMTHCFLPCLFPSTAQIIQFKHTFGRRHTIPHTRWSWCSSLPSSQMVHFFLSCLRQSAAWHTRTLPALPWCICLSLPSSDEARLALELSHFSTGGVTWPQVQELPLTLCTRHWHSSNRLSENRNNVASRGNYEGCSSYDVCSPAIWELYKPRS